MLLEFKQLGQILLYTKYVKCNNLYNKTLLHTCSEVSNYTEMCKVRFLTNLYLHNKVYLIFNCVTTYCGLNDLNLRIQGH